MCVGNVKTWVKLAGISNGPLYLLVSRICRAFWSCSDMDVRGRGLVGYGLFGDAYAKDLVASVPAVKVVEQARLPVPVGVDGQLELNIHHATYASPWCSEGMVLWCGVRVAYKVHWGA